MLLLLSVINFSTRKDHKCPTWKNGHYICMSPCCGLLVSLESYECNNYTHSKHPITLPHEKYLNIFRFHPFTGLHSARQIKCHKIFKVIYSRKWST